MDVCRAAEATKTQLNDMKTNKSTYLSNGDMENRPECRYCGRQHNRGRSYCPAFGKLCAKSGKMNHFLAKCLSSRKMSVKAMHAKKKETLCMSHKGETLFSTMKIGCKPVKMLVDSGASCNVNPANMSPDRQQ